MHHREARDYPTLLLNDFLHVKRKAFLAVSPVLYKPWLAGEISTRPEELPQLAKASRAGGICAVNGSMSWFIFMHTYSELGVIALLADIGTCVRPQTDGS